MAIKVVCHCGLEVISFQKLPGDVIVCKKCGNEMIIPPVSETVTQGTKSISTITVAAAHQGKKQDEAEKQDTKNVSNSVSLLEQQLPPSSSKSMPSSFNSTKTEKNTAPAQPVEKGDSGKRVCPECHNESRPGAVICIECGYNFKTGQKLNENPPVVEPPIKVRKKINKFLFTPEMLGLSLKIAAIVLCVSLIIIFAPTVLKLISGKINFSNIKPPSLENNSATETPKPVNEAEAKTIQTSAISPQEAEYTEEDLDYSVLNANTVMKIHNSAIKQVETEFIKKYSDKYFLFREDYTQKYPYPLNCSLVFTPQGSKKVPISFELKSGIKFANVYLTNINPETKTISVELSPISGSGSKTIALNDIKEEDLFNFDEKIYEEVLIKRMGEANKDFLEQDKFYKKLRNDTLKAFFTKNGYAYSKITNQWAPIKPDKIKSRTVKDLVNNLSRGDAGSYSSYPKSIVSNVIRQDLKETSSPDVETTTSQVQIVFQNNQGVAIDSHIRLKKDKASSVNYKVYRSHEQSANYKLIYEQKLAMEPKAFSSRFNFLDISAYAEKKNYQYYRIDFYNDKDELIKNLPPIKVPIIPQPELSENGWKWSPLDPAGEKLEGFIMNEIVENLYDFVSAIDKPVNHACTDLPSSFNPSVRLMIREYDSIKTEAGDTIFISIPANSFPLKKNSSSHAFSYVYPYQKDFRVSTKEKKDIFLLKSMKVDGNTYLPGFRMREFSCNGVQILAEGKLLKGWKEPVPIRCIGNCDYLNKDVEMTFSLYDMNSKQEVFSDKLQYRFPGDIPIPRVKSTPEGLLVSLPDSLSKYCSEKFAITPEIMLFRREEWMGKKNEKTATGEMVEKEVEKSQEKMLCKLDLSRQSYLDTNMEAGKKYSYRIELSNYIIRIQAWIEGMAQKDFFTNFNAERNCRWSKDVIAADKPEKRPVRIGIVGSCCNFEKTGELEFAVMSQLQKSLLAEKTFIVYDRKDAKKYGNEMRFAVSDKDLEKMKTHPLDFAVYIKDYSQESGNGVEVWLTKLEPEEVCQDNWILSHSWRIGRINCAEKNYSAEESIGKPLVAKIKELNENQLAERVTSAEKPINLFFSTVQPVEQQYQIWQFDDITETLMLQVSNRLKDQRILSRDNWYLLLNERLMTENQDTESQKDQYADALISGYAGKGNGTYFYLFWASDLKTGIIMDSVRLAGDFDKVSGDLAKWCNGLRFQVVSPDDISSRGKYYLRCEKSLWRSDTPSPDDNQPKLTLAREMWDKGFQIYAITVAENEWRNTKSKTAGDQLASFYSGAGLYSRALAILEEIINKDTASASELKYLNGARALVKKGDKPKDLKMLLKPKQKSKNEMSKDVFGTMSASSNDDFERLHKVARSHEEMEWNPAGLIMSNDLFYYIDNVSSVESALNNKPGLWVEYRIDSFRNSNKVNKGLWLKCKAWQSYPLFSGNFYQPGMCKEYLDRPVPVRLLYELNNNPGKIYCKQGEPWLHGETAEKNIIGLDILNMYFKMALMAESDKNQSFQIKLTDYVAADLLAARGDARAGEFISRVMALPIKKDVSGTRQAVKKSYDPEIFTTFRAYKKDKVAINFLMKNYTGDFYDDYEVEDAIYLLGKSGNIELLSKLFSDLKSIHHEHIKVIRWTNKELVKKLIVEMPEIFPKDSNVLPYFIHGFNMTEMIEKLKSWKKQNKFIHGDEIDMLIHSLTGNPVEDEE